MIEFYKDRFGVCVYYERMNSNRGCNRNLIINDGIKFDAGETCVVPFVTKLVDPSTDQSIPFEITDITYSADERMVPLRHTDENQINYFTVDGKGLAVKFASRLCENAGLIADSQGHDRKTYRISESYNGYSSMGTWLMEGKSYSEHLKPISLSSSFTGHLVECRAYINEIEQNIRQCFDHWAIKDKCPEGLNTGMVMDHLREIEKHLPHIQTKKKTQRQFDLAMVALAAAKKEITTIALEDIGADEEEVSDGV